VATQSAASASPEYLRISLAAAMTLGYLPGLFYRGAQLHCINLLLTYPEGCQARCAYCGLSGGRPRVMPDEQSFIRVKWPTHPLADILARIGDRRGNIQRVCISMVTQRRAVSDAAEVCRRLRASVDLPVSLLITPTVLQQGDLEEVRGAGVDKVGVAVDLATPALFERFRGRGVKGPHEWDAYWDCYARAIEVFGTRQAGVHLIVGMGETEKEMCAAIQRARDLGGETHLFSFFPERHSQLETRVPPAMSHYRRVQIARHLIDANLTRLEDFAFDRNGRIRSFGLSLRDLEAIVDSGEPFRTSGCIGADGSVACNRPFANSRPGPNLRNYPFPPTSDDLERIRSQLRL